ncbi:MAG TPA: transglutaminase-like domain-containing protein [Anaerolineales bacterium]|nr:transglutaminase-like domain-containing protein [Anaerolineales bacterium]
MISTAIDTHFLQIPAIGTAAFWLAKGVAFPNLLVPEQCARLDALCQLAERKMPSHLSASGKAAWLAHWLFNVLGFRGNMADYYNPANSYLNCVLDTQLGIPISLSVLYLDVAQRLGFVAYGVGLPAHFVVAVETEGSAQYFDPYHAGVPLTRQDCLERVFNIQPFQGDGRPEWFMPQDNSQIFVRMLNNLKQIYLSKEDWQLSLRVILHLRALQPELWQHTRDVGLVAVRLAQPRLAIQALSTYLEKQATAADASAVRFVLDKVAASYVQLN